MTADSLDIAELLEQWNNHSVPEWTSNAPALFEAQCTATPDATAVVHGERRLTYRELVERVAQLAHAIRDVDARPEAMIAVGVPRSAEMVICVLAAMVAGAAFVPLDPTWPQHRRDQVLADAGAGAALIAPGDESDWGVQTLVVDLDEWGHSDLPTLGPPMPVEPGQLAYVIFTSGSTGKPKGAMIRHEAIANGCIWQVDRSPAASATTDAVSVQGTAVLRHLGQRDPAAAGLRRPSGGGRAGRREATRSTCWT